jgi:hypothetical protein
VVVFVAGVRPPPRGGTKSLASCLDPAGDDPQKQYLISVIHDQASLATPDEHAAIDCQTNSRLPVVALMPRKAPAEPHQ